MKKILSLILSTVLIAMALLPSFSALAEDGVPSVAPVNPYLDGEIAEDGTVDSEITDASTSKTYKSHTYYSNGKQLYTYIKNHLVEGKNFKVYYLAKGTKYYSAYQLRNLLYEFFQYSTDDEIATGCLDGDYLRYNNAVGIEGGSYDTSKDGYYFYTFDMLVDPYLTSAQQTKLNTKINSIVSSLRTSSLSDYEIIKKVHDTICSSTAYDYKTAEDLNGAEDKTPFTAYGALIGGKAVCQGYSNAFYRICKELGYSTRVIVSDPDVGKHAWNLIQLDGKYYYVDCTWDDEIIDDSESTMDEYTYFLVNYKNLKKQDYGSGAHTVFPTYYDNAYYNNKYEINIDSKNYDKTNTALLSRCVVKPAAWSYNYTSGAIKPSVTVKNLNGETLTASVDYTVSYSSNTNTGFANVNVSGKGDYSGSAHRQFKIMPLKVTGVKSSGVTDSTVTVSWNAAGGNVSGYVIERVKDGKWTAIKTVSASVSSTEITSLASAANQYIRIRAYREFSKSRLYSPYSNTYFFTTKPSKVSIKPLTSGAKKMTVSWKKTARATNYQIQYSTDKSMKNAKTVTVSSKTLKKTVKKLKRGKRYYVRVRAFRKYKNPSGKIKYSYGKYSAKKSVKIK